MHQYSQFVQAWFADDGRAGGRLAILRTFWDLLLRTGPSFGYFPEPSKSVLVVKEAALEEAKRIFAGTGLKISSGHENLGAALGSEELVKKFTEEKVADWVRQIELIAEIAKTQPHAAFAAFTHGLQHKWTFFQRTMELEDQLLPV